MWIWQSSIKMLTPGVGPGGWGDVCVTGCVCVRERGEREKPYFKKTVKNAQSEGRI